uniref:Serine-threonine/tyrosine-protein kinase catalytic domain-containing protein n=1 Tax=Leersia perrieri TaxID=77586 RepID=A0A0D9XTS6_9ORYZ
MALFCKIEVLISPNVLRNLSSLFFTALMPLSYKDMTPLQAAIAVVQKDLRPTNPADIHPMLVGLLQKYWQKDLAPRLTLPEILDILNSTKRVVRSGLVVCLKTEVHTHPGQPHVLAGLRRSPRADAESLMACTYMTQILTGQVARRYKWSFFSDRLANQRYTNIIMTSIDY